MQTTFKFFVSCLLCLALLMVSGCGGGGSLFTESVPSLTPAEQAEVDKFIAEHGTGAIIRYMMTTNKDTDENRALKYLKHFLSQGADVDAKNSNGWTSLGVAALRGHVEISNFLVSKGADVHAKSNGGYTPLHAAAEEGHIEVVKFLISKGADVNVESTRSEITPLDSARDNRRTEVAEYLSSIGGTGGRRGIRTETLR